MNDNLGKKAETKIKEWLDKPDIDFNRIPDQMTGLYGSKNICDFDLYISPNKWYIESKATWGDRFDFSMISEFQFNHMIDKSKIPGVSAVIIALFASHQRAFVFPIQEIARLMSASTKSLNIKKIDKWEIKYQELETIPSRKQLLDYTGVLKTTSEILSQQ